MKRIPLSQGQFAIVDDKIYAKLSKYKWYALWDKHTQSYYAARSIRLLNGKRELQLMHRRILGLKHGDNRQGDHIDHDTLDNRRSNIRIVTNQENQHNKRAKGYYKQGRKYQAKIKVKGILIYLGLFNTRSEARAAYLTAKRIYHPSAPISKNED